MLSSTDDSDPNVAAETIPAVTRKEEDHSSQSLSRRSLGLKVTPEDLARLGSFQERLMLALALTLNAIEILRFNSWSITDKLRVRFRPLVVYCCLTFSRCDRLLSDTTLALFSFPRPLLHTAAMLWI